MLSVERFERHEGDILHLQGAENFPIYYRPRILRVECSVSVGESAVEWVVSLRNFCLLLDGVVVYGSLMHVVAPCVELLASQITLVKVKFG